MMRFILRSLALYALAQFALVASGQSTSTSGSPSQTSSGSASTFTISVGNNHQFQPDVVQANVGDIIEFDFMPTNHSVVRAEYKFPCIPYEKTGAGKIGFFSGFHPVDAILSKPPTWTVRVNDSNPIFFYCSAPGSCIDFQMVGVINPNASVSLQTQKSLAESSKYMLQPGEDFPSETTDTASASTATATATATSSSSSSSTGTSTAIPVAGGHKSSLPAGAIAGIVIGAVVVVGLAAALFFFIGRTKTLDETVKRQSQPPPMFSAPPDHPMYQTGAPAYMAVNPRNSQMSGGYDMQYPKPDGGQWSSRGGSPPPQFYAGTASPQLGPPGGMAEERNTIHGLKTTHNVGPVEMYAPIPKDGNEA